MPAFAAEAPPAAELEGAPPPSAEHDLLADFADLQVMPFSFDEAGILSETPPAPAPSAPEPAAAAPEEPAAQAPAALPAEAPLTTPLDFADLEFEPFSFDEATILESTATPPPAAAVPPAPPVAELPPLPAEAPAAEAPAAPEVPAAGAAAPGAQAAIEDFDFGDIQPFDLSALELTPEERAYLMGDASGDTLEATAGQARAATEATPVEEALADEPAAEDAGGILELQTLQTYVAERLSTQDIQPFAFDESAYTSPIGEDAEEPPAAAPTAPPPPAVPAQAAPEPRTAALPEEPSPFATEALGAQDAAEAGAESPSPFALPDEDLFGAESWTEMSMDRIFDFNAFSPETAALGAEQVEPTEALSGDITRAFGEAEMAASPGDSPAPSARPR